MTESDNLVMQMAQEAHELACHACRDLNAAAGAAKYIEAMTGDEYGEEEVLRSVSYANMARQKLGTGKAKMTGAVGKASRYDREEGDRRFAAYIAMLKTVYGDSLKDVAGVDVEGIKDVKSASASDLIALARETGTSLNWLMGGGA